MSTNDKVSPSDQADLACAVRSTMAADRVFRSLLRSARAAGLPQEMAIRCASRAAVASTGVDVLAALGLAETGTGPADMAGFAFGGHADPVPASAKAVRRVSRPPIREYGIPAFVGAWKAGRLAIPHTVCRTSELYRAYLLWCAGVDVEPIYSKGFLGKIERLDPEVTRSTLKVEGRNARLLIPAGHRRKVPMDMWVKHAESEATQFRSALLEWEAKS